MAGQNGGLGKVDSGFDYKSLLVCLRSIDLADRIGAKTVGVVAVLVAGGDHQEAEPDDVGESVRDLIRCALILDTASKTISDAQPLLDLAQHQDAAVR